MVSSPFAVSPRLFQRRFMIRPRFLYQVGLLIAVAAIWGASSVLGAEQPPAVTPPAESKSAQRPNAKPQVIYRLPRTSSYAATLHSQAKSQSSPLPADNKPAEARPEQTQSPSGNQLKNAMTSPQQKVKRPKMQSTRPKMRGPGPSKARGPGKSHGKSGKK
jgi:hypothetical protein